MLKRMIALLVAVMMLCGMLQGVSASETADPYEYFPRDITLVSYEGDEGAVVAWKNPTSTLLSKVTVTNVSDGVEIGVVSNPTPGQISRVCQTTTSVVDYGSCTVKLVFEFTDGEKREIYYTNDKRNYNLSTVQTAGKISITNLNDWNVFTTNTQNATTGGSNSLMVVSNINPEVNGNSAQLFFNRLATGGGGSFTVEGSLKNSTRYNFEYKIKTADALTLNHYINSSSGNVFHDNSNSVTVSPSDDWQTVSGSFTTAADVSTGGYKFFGMNFKQATSEPFYIDDVKLTEMTGNDTDGYTEYTGADTSSYTFDMEDVTGTPSKPAITANAGDASAVFNWTKEAGFINVYEVIDGTRVLRARMHRNGSDTSVNIPYLTNNKLYKFEVTAMTYTGLESEAAAFELMPMAVIPDTAPEKYEYEPGNLMVVGNRGGSYAGISWINPTSDKLTEVKAYLINADKTETDLTASAAAAVTGTTINTPSAVVRLSNTTTATSGRISYRLVFKFSDGEVRDIVYTGTYQATGGVQFIQSVHDTQNSKGVDIYENGGRDSNIAPDTLTTLSNTVYKNGTTALRLTSNSIDEETGNYELINLATPLTAADYDVAMWINTIEKSPIDINGIKVELPNTGGQWVKFSAGTFSNFSVLKITTKHGGFREAYIDDITLTAAGGTAPACTITFENNLYVPANVGSVAAVSANSSANISWTPIGTNFVSIYEKLSDGELVLRARVNEADGNVVLKNLKNDKEYTFVLKTESSNRNYGLGLQSAGVETTVTPAVPLPTKYDYEPGNVSITDWRVGFTLYGHKLSWINPVSDKLNGVKIYKINSDGTETEVTPAENDKIFIEGASGTNVAITTPGAIVHINDQKTDEAYQSGNAKYRLVFSFSDGEVRNIIYGNDWKKHQGEQLVNTAGKVIAVYAGYEYGVPQTGTNATPHTQSSAAEIKMSSKTAPEGDVLSMELTSNQTEATTGRYFIISTLAADNTTDQLTVSMKINTQEKTVVQIGASDVVLPDTNGEWTDFTADFIPHNKTQLQIKTKEAAREFYIGGPITVKNSAGDTKFSYDIDTDGALSSRPEVKGVTAVAGNKKTTISWTEATGQYINVYQKIDLGDWMLRARVPVSDMSVTLENLENDVENMFMVKAEYGGNTWLGLEGTGVECTSKFVSPDYEIDGVGLLSDGTSIEKITEGGTYTASAKVINNKRTNGLDAQLIVAVYADGVLESCFVSEKKNIALGNNDTLTAPVKVGSLDKCYTAKVMVWEGLESARPLLAPSGQYAE